MKAEGRRGERGRRWRRRLAGKFAVAWAGSCLALPVSAQSMADTALVARYFERLEPFGFSGSVIVAAGPDLVFARAYGMADREREQAFEPSTVVTIGSITKPITAAAILKLQEQGALSVRDSLARFIDGVPEDKRSITLHHLLTHTSGLRRNGLDGGDFVPAATRSAVLAEALGSDLLFPPGGGYAYSNLGYSILAMVVEEAAGMPYETYLRRHLLIPAGMYRTGYTAPWYADGELAAGYRGDRRIDPVIRQPMLADGPTWNLRGNGGLHSDPFDMARFVAALHGGLLTDESLAAMTAPHAEIVGEAHYGYGWEVRRRGGGRDISHSGGNGYFAAVLHWFPDDDVMFFVATNEATRVNTGQLADAVRSLLAGDAGRLPPEVVTLDSDALEALTGSYVLGPGDTVVVEATERTLVARAVGDGAMQIVLGGDTDVENPGVARIASRSRHIIEREFAGDFQPKSDAMDGAVSVADLARYHRYDREVWDEQYGSLDSVVVVAAAGAREEVRVVLRLEFDRAAAGQVYTWREGRLANVAVVPAWSEFRMERVLHPRSAWSFESFSIGTALRLSVRFDDDVLYFPGRSAEAPAVREPSSPGRKPRARP